MTTPKKKCCKKVDLKHRDNTCSEIHDQFKPNNPEWTTYVLRHLQDSELKNGNPTVDGLRRITGIVYGDIIHSETELLEIPSRTYEKCTAKHKIVLKRYADEEIVEVSAVVDVRYNKTESPYNEYLVATADTRAEGKALRRLLKLSIITAEELSEKDEDDLEGQTVINDNQVNAINLLCQRLDINVEKMIKTYVKEFKHIRDVPYLAARQIITQLSNYQRDLDSIPKDIAGFSSRIEG